MNMHLVFVVPAAVVVASAGYQANAQEQSWKGEKVLPTKPHKDIQFGDVVDGKQVYFPFSRRWSITVRDDREGWLRIHDGHHEGWVDKADFMLVRDAPAYFHRLVQANPKDTWALHMRGTGSLAKGEPDNAITDFDDCIRLDPKDAGAHIHRSVAHMRLRRPESAKGSRACSTFRDGRGITPCTRSSSVISRSCGRGTKWQRSGSSPTPPANSPRPGRTRRSSSYAARSTRLPS